MVYFVPPNLPIEGEVGMRRDFDSEPVCNDVGWVFEQFPIGTFHQDRELVGSWIESSDRISMTPELIGFAQPFGLQLIRSAQLLVGSSLFTFDIAIGAHGGDFEFHVGKPASSVECSACELDLDIVLRLNFGESGENVMFDDSECLSVYHGVVCTS
jgi:hypothetical protein